MPVMLAKEATALAVDGGSVLLVDVPAPARSQLWQCDRAKQALASSTIHPRRCIA
jgi:hypothetical protein